MENLPIFVKMNTGNYDILVVHFEGGSLDCWWLIVLTTVSGLMVLSSAFASYFNSGARAEY